MAEPVPLRRCRRGAATVEFALTLPLLLLFFAIGADYSRAFRYEQVLATCAQNGAMFAATVEIEHGAIQNSATEAALLDAGDMRDEMEVEVVELNSGSGQPCIEVTTRYLFQPVVHVPFLPSEIPLAQTVRMRLRNPEDDESP